MSDHNHGSPDFEGHESVSTSAPPVAGALVTQAPGVHVPMAITPSAPRADVIRGGVDAASLFHSFRRRWLLALGMGVLLGAAAAIGLYIAFPVSSSAVALFRVDSKQETIFKKLEEDSGFDIFRRTQVVAIKSPFVLSAALESPTLADVTIFDDIEPENRISWLASELKVRFPQDSEYLEISLTGTANPDELVAVVDAVSTAYYDEVAFKQFRDRQKPVEILRKSEDSLLKQIQRETDAYYDLLRESGTSPARGADHDITLKVAEGRDLVRQIAGIETGVQQMALTFELNKRYLTDPAIIEQRIDQAIDADPRLIEMQDQMMAMQLQMQSSQTQYRGGKAAQQMQSQLGVLQQQIATYRAQLKQMMTEKLEDGPDTALKTLSMEYQMTTQLKQQQLNEAKTKLAAVLEELKAKGEVNTDIEMKKAKLEQLKAIQRGIRQRIDEWGVEAGAPMRVQRIEGVERTPNINRTQRFAIAGAGGLAAFTLTCFGIAYMEFRNRRLNGPEQVDEGLGIRVIGTLPSLSGRKSLDSRHPVVAQLTESIDSVRTALMHESATKRRQVVLVTSAATLEGRTTVASQLAASLARAGRRTLLIDGDLRRPALHTLFDVPLEDGLSEVLRAESDIADVVRPTHAEGLWLMTAGYCDADAVHALATDQAQPIFEKLRSDYDFIVIDGAPVLGLSDSLLFGQHCDGAILSVLRDHTNVPKIHQSSELLKSVGIRMIGAVVNGVPIKADRRVTHLQVTGAKSARKQLENAEA
ncbi:MAG: polysaccharide biosynthesis tyrosine autokinase [Planctomycetota bacterium]